MRKEVYYVFGGLCLVLLIAVFSHLSGSSGDNEDYADTYYAGESRQLKAQEKIVPEERSSGSSNNTFVGTPFEFIIGEDGVFKPMFLIVFTIGNIIIFRTFFRSLRRL